MKPEIIESRKVYESRIFNVSVAKIRENGVVYERDIVEHAGSAVIVPVFADKTVALVRQYRHPAREYLLELPAGSLELNENPEIGAIRELEEEIGVRAGKIEKLTEFYVSPGFLSEKMFVYLATDLEEVGQKLEDDELLSVERLSFPQIFDLIKSGGLKDAKTMLGTILASARFGFSFS